MERVIYLFLLISPRAVLGDLFVFRKSKFTLGELDFGEVLAGNRLRQKLILKYDLIFQLPQSQLRFLISLAFILVVGFFSNLLL